ncbi:UNVERIFIED_CONTAM: hypothetical protein POZ17_15785 [Ralstonia mannitolilytica]
MKKILINFFLVSSISAYGQVGINTATPKVSLDIEAKSSAGLPDGILIPRIDRQRAINMTSIPVSTLIYINDVSTGTQTGIGINIDSRGFYYFDGDVWRTLESTNSPTSGATIQKLRYLGLTDASKTLIVDGFYEVRFIQDGASTIRFQVRLLNQPTANFILRYNRNASYNLTTNAFSSTMTFTPVNYSTWQNFDSPTISSAGVSFWYTGTFSSPERDKLHKYVLHLLLNNYINLSITSY